MAISLAVYIQNVYTYKQASMEFRPDDVDFEWDDAKNEANLAKRGIDFDDAISIFDGRVLERVDTRRDYGETRIIAI
jgi:hypothetical protein